MWNLSRMRKTALAALVLIGGIGGIGGARAQSIADGASAVSAASAASTASAVVASASSASAPVVAAAPLPAMPASEQSASAAAPDDTKGAQGTVAELQRLMHGNGLTELRTTYNGSYGASLLLDGDEMAYYVALFQQKNFWRVIKTNDDVRAEAIYADFVRKSAQLADIEVRRAKLAAQKAYSDRLIALSQARADRLQADVDVARQQQIIVAGRQKAAHDEAAALQQQERAAQDQLRDVRRQVRHLQSETEQGLPRHAH